MSGFVSSAVDIVVDWLAYLVRGESILMKLEVVRMRAFFSFFQVV